MRYQNQKIENATLHLDKDQFVNCTLIRCKLLFGGETVPVMRGCTMRDCDLQFVGASELTIKLLGLMLQMREFRKSVLSYLDLPAAKRHSSRVRGNRAPRSYRRVAA